MALEHWCSSVTFWSECLGALYGVKKKMPCEDLLCGLVFTCKQLNTFFSLILYRKLSLKVTTQSQFSAIFILNKSYFTQYHKQTFSCMWSTMNDILLKYDVGDLCIMLASWWFWFTAILTDYEAYITWGYKWINELYHIYHKSLISAYHIINMCYISLPLYFTYRDLS